MAWAFVVGLKSAYGFPIACGLTGRVAIDGSAPAIAPAPIAPAAAMNARRSR